MIGGEWSWRKSCYSECYEDIHAMPVYLGFKVKASAEMSHDGMLCEEKKEVMEEQFMINDFCDANMQVYSLLKYIDTKYPFLESYAITDLDGEIGDEQQTVGEVWNNYKSYTDHGLRGLVDVVVDVDEDIYLWANCRYIGTTEIQLHKYHSLIVQNQLLEKFIIESKRWDLHSGGIKFPNNKEYDFSGHSYDGLKGSKVMVDQLLTSSEKYVLENINTGASVELSTQQCIIVDTSANNSVFKPYIMVNKSGLRQLEMLGPIGSFKVRIGIPEAVKDGVQGEGCTIDNKPVLNSAAAIVLCQKSLTNIFHDALEAKESGYDIVEEDELKLRQLIEHEVAPVLDELSHTLFLEQPDPFAKTSNLWSRSYRRMRELARRFHGTWIANGLFVRAGSELLQYLIRCAVICLVFSRLSILYNIVFITVILVCALRDKPIEIIAEIGEVTGLRPIIILSNLLKMGRNGIKTLNERSLRAIVRLCIVGREERREDSSAIEADAAGEHPGEYPPAVPLEQGRLYTLGLLLAHAVQDCVLLVLTLFPPFAHEYRQELARTFQQ